jgi:hypothetical protein
VHFAATASANLGGKILATDQMKVCEKKLITKAQKKIAKRLSHSATIDVSVSFRVFVIDWGCLHQIGGTSCRPGTSK